MSNNQQRRSPKIKLIGPKSFLSVNKDSKVLFSVGVKDKDVDTTATHTTTYYKLHTKVVKAFETMRMYTHPGRGGREALLYRRPKYLNQKPPILKFGNRYNPEKNRYGILDDQFNLANLFSIRDEPETLPEEEENSNRTIPNADIPNSFNALENEVAWKGAPQMNKTLEKNTNEHTKVTRRKTKKSKYNTKSPKNYYAQFEKSHLMESTEQKFHKNVDKMEVLTEKDLPKHSKEPKDVEMTNVEENLTIQALKRQYDQLCVEMKSAKNLDGSATEDDYEEAIQELLELKEAQMMDATNIHQEASKSSTKKQKTSLINASFSPSFIREEEAESETNLITPEKNRLEANNSNLIDIIKKVANSTNFNIPASDYEEMKKWSQEDLRKKIGELNIYKRDKFKNTSTLLNDNLHPQQNRTLFLSDNDSAKPFDEDGLNAMKVLKVFDANKVSDHNKHAPPTVINPDKCTTKAKGQIRHTYSARIRLSVGRNPINVGLILKQMFDLWQEADSSVILLSHIDETDHALMIDDTNKIPEEEAEVKKYIAGLYSYNQRLHFTLRFSGHQDLSVMKKRVFSWMGRNSSFASIDKVKAAVVHTVGFLHNIHPDYYNREELKKKIKQHLGRITEGDDINVFPRKMWIMNKGSKLQTRALVIAAPKLSRDSVNRKMMSFTAKEYTNSTYVPFSHVTNITYQEIITEFFFSKIYTCTRLQKNPYLELLMQQHNFLLKKEKTCLSKNGSGMLAMEIGSS